jgi:hypothetical protein
MPNYFYYQGPDKQSPWKPVPANAREKTLAGSDAVFCTVLSVSKLVDSIEPAEKDKLAYEGPFYLDWDSLDIGLTIQKVNQVLDKFAEMGVDLNSIALYASGQKGFHAELPQALFMEKVPKAGTPGLPWIYKEMVFELGVDTLDLKVYSHGKGRMWRIPNVVRPDNGMYKVPLTVAEMRAMTPELYAKIIKAPRSGIELAKPEFNVDLHLMFANAKQKVEERLAARKNRKRDPQAKLKARMPSVQLMMMGQGLKPGVGFHQIAIQIAIACVTAGVPPEQMVQECAVLIETHQSDGNRYNTPTKRKAELLRLYDYMLDNPGYDFSVGAIKSILVHEAPDLDGLHVDKADVEQVIAEAEATAAGDAEKDPDEYADVAGGVTLSRFGVYVDTEHGKKRVVAVSFQDVHLLYSMETGQLVALEVLVLVNGKSLSRQTMELDTFATLQSFNNFCRKFGHAMQGTEAHVRGLMMRVVEEGKKKGKMLYITQREGLDVINIPNHPEPALREPFMVFASGHGVLVDPRVRKHNVEISFQGFPDPRGTFRTDLADAPGLGDWIEESAGGRPNKDALYETLNALFQMQKPEVIAKMLGWYTACFYRMLFHRAYGKFPLLHVNGPAGSGKTEMNTLAFASLFYYNQEAKAVSPASTVFAIQQHITSSASIPLILDEYKPDDMDPNTYNKYRLMLRDTYNCREITKGGGTRESDDYRTLHSTQLTAPVCFIAEAAESESAIAERIVLVTLVKPSSSVGLRYLAHFNTVVRNSKHLGILGNYLATETIEEMSIETLQNEFDALYAKAKKRFLLTDDDITDGKLSQEELATKQGAKERSVFNFTVAHYGLKRFRRLIEMIYEEGEFKALFDSLEDNVYGRMQDLQAVTQPEWAKVLVQMVDMSWNLDPDSPCALRPGREYAVYSAGGHDFLEISLRTAYLKYRSYCAQHRSKALFPGDSAFLHAMKDCMALTSLGTGQHLKQPGIGVFDMKKLEQAGIMPFKPPSGVSRH